MSGLISPLEISKLNLNCASESKTGVLTLCSGVTVTGLAPNQPKLNFNESTVKPLDKRLSHLQGGFGFKAKALQGHHQINSGSENHSPKLSKLQTLPRRVKVSVYSNVVNPYLVIYNSTEKYSKPAACLKLLSCTVRVMEDDCEEKSFEIVSHKHQGSDVDSNSNIICLRAPSQTVREDWLNALTPLTTASRCADLPGYQPGSSALPTLQEDEGETTSSTGQPLSSPNEKLKIKPRRKSLEGRRNSLNSIGVRLRSYKFGRGNR